ncbi:MAG: hypothetical protein KC431_07605 [Myxococcales bacterium]|nr:hypothetical protein [Myxococcales bacterium]
MSRPFVFLLFFDWKDLIEITNDMIGGSDDVGQPTRRGVTKLVHQWDVRERTKDHDAAILNTFLGIFQVWPLFFECGMVSSQIVDPEQNLPTPGLHGRQDVAVLLEKLSEAPGHCMGSTLRRERGSVGVGQVSLGNLLKHHLKKHGNGR